MITPIPNSGSAEDADRFAEYNTCHAAGSGEFCSKGGGAPDARGFSQGKPASAKRASNEAWRQFSQQAKTQRTADEKKHGPNYMATHRGVEIHTLPHYTTPYYYAKHPALGTFHHTMSFQRVKNQINDILDKGMTPRKKASARYQKRKARYGG